MIVRSLIIVGLLLVIFEVTLRLRPINWDTSQNDKSANLIGAQNFVFNKAKLNRSKDTIIVGSSISRKLIIDTLGHNFINLAFNGWSAYDGLDLLKRTKTLPSCILIESNSLRDVLTQQEIVNIFDPILSYKKLIKSTQLQNQPVGLLIGFLKNQMKSKILAAKQLKRSNVTLYNYSIQMIKKEYSIALADSISIRRLSKLKGIVDEFKKQNVKIIFFEVPIDTALMHTTYMNSARNYYSNYFPDSVYSYIHPPVSNYIYSDGIHLLPESATDYTNYLKKSLSNFAKD